MVGAVAELQNGLTVVEGTGAAMPRVVQVPLSMLRVALADPGPGYQRAPDQRRVRKIAAQWDWGMCDPLVVSVRRHGPQPGQYFIVDGQHRYLAALERFSESQEVPALLVHLTFEEEAFRFARQQENQRRVNPSDLFRAKLQARDEEALAIRDIVERNGWHVAVHNAPSRSNDIVAVAALVSIYRSYGANVLETMLHVVGEAYGRRYESSDHRILQGVAHFLYYFPVADVKSLIERLSAPEAQPKRLLQKAAVYGLGTGGTRGGAPVSRAILDEYNRGRRSTGRLEWDLKKYRQAAKRTEKGGADAVAA